MTSSRRIVDLSHPIRSGMRTYPGLPGPRVEPYVTHSASRASYAGQSEFTITRFFMLGSTGTYLDSPWHRHPDGADLAQVNLGAVADLDGICIEHDAVEGREIKLTTAAHDLAGRAVLVRTGWSARWGGPAYWAPGPYLGADAVQALVLARPAIVGVDFWNADDPDDPRRPAHTQLLGAGIPIVEHLTGLEQLPSEGFRFFAVPPAIESGASFPVRALAVIG
jgi:arylformamidase